MYSLGYERRQGVQERGTTCAKIHPVETVCLKHMNGVKFMDRDGGRWGKLSRVLGGLKLLTSSYIFWEVSEEQNPSWIWVLGDYFSSVEGNWR